MLKINKKVEYALIALKQMLDKSEGDLTTAREISDRFSTPFDTTAKVMQLMNNAGILESIKGVKGGYYLTDDLNSLSYLKLAELIEGKPLSMDCSAMKCSLIGTCNITGPVTRLNTYMDAFLRSLSVRELLSEEYPVNLSSLTKIKETEHEL